MTAPVPTSTNVANYLADQTFTDFTPTLGANLFSMQPEPRSQRSDGAGVPAVAIFVFASGGFSPTIYMTSSQVTQERISIVVRGKMRSDVNPLAVEVRNAMSGAGILGYASVQLATDLLDLGYDDDGLVRFTFDVLLRRTGGPAQGSASNPSAAGGDLGGAYPNPSVVAVHEDGVNGTRLTIANIDDGQYLKRVGTTIAGVTLEAVPTSRLISTTAPLQGGGDLSADRTLSLADSGASAGSYGSSSAIPVLTVSAKGLITSISTAAINTTSLGAVPTSRTLTGTAPITVGGVSGSPQDLSADRTIAHANSGVTAATYGDKNNPTLLAISSTGHVTSAEDYRVLDDTVMWRAWASYPQWSTSNLGSVVEDAPVSGSIADTQVNNFISSASVTAVKRLGFSPFRLRWDGSTRGYVSMWVLCPVALPSTGTTMVIWGLLGIVPSGTTLPSSGCYFAFLSTTSGTKVLCVTANSGTTTVTTTSVDFSANVMREYRVELAKDRSSVVFIIDGTTVATHTSNLPATSILLAHLQTELKTSATAASLGVGVARATLIAKL